MTANKIHCPDCGPTPAIHWVEKSSAIMSWASSFLDSIAGAFKTQEENRLPSQRGQRLLLRLFKLIHFLHLGRLVLKSEPSDTGRVQVLWEAAQARGVMLYRLRMFNVPSEFFIAEYKGILWSFVSMPRPFNRKSNGKEWMDNKEEMREVFAKNNIPIAKGGPAFFWSTAQKIFSSVGGPVIVKPSFGSRSRHTTIHITNIEGLHRAFRIAKKLDPRVIIEEELQGVVHRATVIGGKVVGVLRRDPPYVVGDGMHTVKELVEIANADERRNDVIFHKLIIDGEMEAELAYQHLRLESVPEKGARITLGQKIGRSNGGVNSDVTDSVHPENSALFKRVLDVLEDSIVGIDMILQDVSKPWHEQQHVGVIECNSMPFVDLHHNPFEGQVRDAAGALWDTVLSSLPNEAVVPEQSSHLTSP